MTNRFRFYSLLVVVVAICLMFTGGRAALNQYFHHSKQAVPLADLPALPAEQPHSLVLINNYSGNDYQGVQSEILRRPSQVIRTDGTVLLDGDDLVLSSHNRKFFPRFAALETLNQQQYIVASIQEEGYETQYRLFAVQPDVTLKEIALPEACSGDRRVDEEQKLWQNCESLEQMSLSPDGTLFLINGWQYTESPYGKIPEEEQPLTAGNYFFLTWNSEAGVVTEHGMRDVMQQNGIAEQPGLQWSIEWEKDSPHTAFIIFYKEIEGVHQHVARLRYDVLQNRYETIALDADYGPLLVQQAKTAALQIDYGYLSAEQQSPLRVESINSDYVNVWSREYWKWRHSATVQKVSTSAQTQLIQWKGLFQESGVTVHILDRNPNPQRYLVTINDSVYVYDAQTKQYALLTQVPYDPNFGINSIEVVIPQRQQ